MHQRWAQILYACRNVGVSNALRVSLNRQFDKKKKMKKSFGHADMPFGMCTREKYPWCEYAENCEHGPSTTFLKRVNLNGYSCDSQYRRRFSSDFSWLNSIAW